MPLHFLTDAEVQLLQEMLDDYRNRRVAQPKRPYTEEEEGQAPECYIAWPPSGGIPALTKVGDIGPDGGNDQPGSATCSIYIINDTGTAELQPVANFDRTVYNLSEVAIPRRWITIQRTKYGKWIATQEMAVVTTDIMVGHRIDDSNNKKFETLWQQFHLQPAEDTTSDWRTDHTGADCS